MDVSEDGDRVESAGTEMSLVHSASYAEKSK
jgi:hypothetical protein